MADLLTLPEYHALAGLDITDTRDDAKISALIPGASKAIIGYTERDFGSPTVTEARSFPYDYSGVLDIDDASAITEVRFLVPNGTDMVLDSDQWYGAPARRDDSPVYYYIVLTALSGGSPLMGFERNADVLAAEGRLSGIITTAVVTATWGWPVVPDDVKMATFWTVQDWSSKSGGEELTSEAIEGYSRSWGGAGGQASPSQAIPNRARDILANYQKIWV